MTIEDLETWIKTCLWISAIFTSLVPVLYLFSPWYKSAVGWVVMFRSITFAIVLDLTLLFQYWAPTDVLTIFWIDSIAYGLIAVSSVGMLWVIWRTNHHSRHMKEVMSDREAGIVEERSSPEQYGV